MNIIHENTVPISITYLLKSQRRLDLIHTLDNAFIASFKVGKSFCFQQKNTRKNENFNPKLGKNRTKSALSEFSQN